MIKYATIIFTSKEDLVGKNITYIHGSYDTGTNKKHKQKAGSRKHHKQPKKTNFNPAVHRRRQSWGYHKNSLGTFIPMN